MTDSALLELLKALGAENRYEDFASKYGVVRLNVVLDIRDALVATLLKRQKAGGNMNSLELIAALQTTMEKAVGSDRPAPTIIVWSPKDGKGEGVQAPESPNEEQPYVPAKKVKKDEGTGENLYG